MSDYYSPDVDAYPNTLDSIKLLSQRDLAVRVPINYVPVAGIRVSAACSIADIYDAAIFARCISNLLVTGFRRFTLDLYWDESRSLWSFCPVQLGSAGQVSNSSTTAAGSSRTTSTLSAMLSARDVEIRTVTHKDARQLTATTAIASMTTATSTPSPSATSSLIHVGPYACSPSTNLDIFMDVLVSFLANTDFDLNATTTYLDLDIHAATTSDLIPRPPSNLPDDGSSLGEIVVASASSYLYTPGNLQQQRADLNATTSWFSVNEAVRPDAAYFNVTQKGSTYITPNGWPSDSFVEFNRQKRLLVGFGGISSEMSSYDVAMDTDTIFGPGYIEQSHQYTLTTAGDLSSGCFFNAESTEVASVNNSWAVASVSFTDASTASQGSAELNNCGYTAVLNQTLNNVTAATSPSTYHEFVMSTIWSWDVLEPKDSSNSSMDYHCAVLNATSGNWQVEDCGADHYCACRVGHGPYNWQISSDNLPYDRVDQTCPQGSTFTVARTALENSYLLNAWRKARTASSTSDELLFLNFNDLDVATCWVIGQNATCPYQASNNNKSTTITVPTVAAVIVFVLTILTIFVKCAANRQNTKRRRRRGNDDFGDYEGVPA